ncbi:Short-chain dehydrogenase [Friedmanniella luteola]|uniref:Short-chain dehydrogenase n=1 Tax=Friedmanniella luteola TaxID=546871 RepID=A0A1H2A769_9ACTN|nr:SDR family NAD(P)-dependent oxidoreductase [Friedmanniella luteola]SDT41316.1 Short-chain dehydrogenase [Friedmanniella luteola]
MSRLEPFVFAGATAVLTGAASGMGEQLAHQLADRGTALVLLDRDADRLDRVAAAVRVAHPGLGVEVHVVDLAETARIASLVAEILAAHPRVDLLVNNAGIALAGRFDQISLEDFDAVLRVNLTAPVTLTHHLLPTLLASPGSHVVNVSSLYGLIAPPGQSAYATSKFGLRGFSQVLQAELGGRGVGVTTVHPGGIRTRIAETARVGQGVDPQQAAVGKARAARVLTYPAERAAADILEAVEHRRVRLLIAPSAKVPDALARLLPVGHVRALSWLMGGGGRRR